jgi:hypothetical protein
MKKILLFVGILLVAVALIISFLNKDYLSAYYYNIKHNHFKRGDKLYMVSNHSQDLMLLIKPIDPNSSKKPYLIDFGWQINIDSVKKYKARSIGVYLHHKILNFNSDESYPRLNFYAIKPDKRLLDKNGLSEQIPSGFELAQAPLYIFAISVK